MQLSEGTAQQLVDQLDRAQDIASEALLLRRIKNNVTGHELRKVAYIRAGIIPAISETLSSRCASVADETTIYTFQPYEEAIWWHASSIIMVLANAGTAFTYAILDGSLVQQLMKQLRITDPTERVAFNLIQCLNIIAEHLPLEHENSWGTDQSLAGILYTPENVACLVRFATILPKTWQAQQQVEAVLVLICNTCRLGKHVALLVDSGLLNVLCRHLAACVLLHGFDGHARWNEATSQPSHLHLVLETMAIIIKDSKERTQELAVHDAIEKALILTMGSTDTLRRLAPHGSFLHGLNLAEQQISYDFPLPLIPDLHAMYLAKRSVWPPLPRPIDEPSIPRWHMSYKTSRSNSPAQVDAWVSSNKTQLQDFAIVSWLLCAARGAERLIRIMAAKILVIFKSHDMLSGQTVRSLAALLIPTVVEMVDKQPDFSQPSSRYAEQVPGILALLVRDHEYLQQAAVEAQAIPRVTASLKTNLESTIDTPHDLWWPSRLNEKLTMGVRDRSLGPGGPSRQMRMQMLMREGLLQALAALAPESDVFRKEICDQGALNHIILALEPFQARLVMGKFCDRMATTGNSSEALIAACGAVRALTRSPTSLRTKIVDADVAKHIIKLLYATEPAVRVAAIMVVANLSHGFSPMKNSIAELPVIKRLCEQAHSANALLRRETLFALKAFINLSTNKVKRMVVEELGISWIRHLIATDPHDVPPGEVIGLIEKDYRKGSRIRVSGDADMRDADADDADKDPEGYNHHTLEQDLEIQVELLGFLRNLTTGENSLEIIDYILDEIGRDEFLQIMVDRLKANMAEHLPLAGKIIQNCIYIIAHLAIADSKYRSPIAHHLVLMKQTNTFLGHSDPLIRRACCWLIIGVIYSTTESHQAAVSRARDLQRLGIVANLRRMEKNDVDTDVKERASTACDVFGKLLDKT